MSIADTPLPEGYYWHSFEPKMELYGLYDTQSLIGFFFEEGGRFGYFGGGQKVLCDTIEEAVATFIAKRRLEI